MLRAGWGSWRACLMWGLATLAVAQSFALVMPQSMAHPIPGASIDNPVLAFEFARTQAHLDAVFGLAGDPQRDARIAGMMRGNILDYLFMVVYGSFVLAFFGATATTLGRARWWYAGWLGPLAAAADAVENALLLSINADMTASEVELTWLPWPVWAKFCGLALACGLAAIALARQRAWFAALLCLPAPLMIGFGIASPLRWGQPGVSAIAVGWVAMLGWAAWLAWRAGGAPRTIT